MRLTWAHRHRHTLSTHALCFLQTKGSNPKCGRKHRELMLNNNTHTHTRKLTCTQCRNIDRRAHYMDSTEWATHTVFENVPRKSILCDKDAMLRAIWQMCWIGSDNAALRETQKKISFCFISFHLILFGILFRLRIHVLCWADLGWAEPSRTVLCAMCILQMIAIGCKRLCDTQFRFRNFVVILPTEEHKKAANLSEECQWFCCKCFFN